MTKITCIIFVCFFLENSQENVCRWLLTELSYSDVVYIFICPIISSFKWCVSGLVVNGLSKVQMPLTSPFVDAVIETFYSGWVFFSLTFGQQKTFLLYWLLWE